MNILEKFPKESRERSLVKSQPGSLEESQEQVMQESLVKTLKEVYLKIPEGISNEYRGKLLNSLKFSREIPARLPVRILRVLNEEILGIL